MAEYEFRCWDCGNRLTVRASMREIGNLRPVCIVCHGDMHRVFNPPGIVFKGSGWAGKKEKKSKDKKPEKKQETPDGG